MPLARELIGWKWGGIAGLLLPLAVTASLSKPVRAQAIEPSPTVLHLSQTAERKAVRDLLRVELRVEETGADPLALQSAINRRMAAALGRAHQTPGIEVETGAYAVNQEQPEHGPSHWRASQSLILSGKGADAVLKLAGALQSDGLLMSSLDYQVSPASVHEAEQALTAEALAGLDHRAAEIAGRMHLAVLRYRDLRVGNAEAGEPPIPRFAMMATAMPAPVAEPGEATIRVTASADLLLGPPHGQAAPR
ncbi:MAG TPA: SIMPL domain-containing protein [Stellaceae bacterium]|jgi:predicted secreted protein